LQQKSYDFLTGRALFVMTLMELKQKALDGLPLRNTPARLRRNEDTS
jgi:hypothetical protein